MELNKKSINDYLSLLWVPGPNTIFKDIQKLPAGELLEIDFNNKKINKEKIESCFDDIDGFKEKNCITKKDKIKEVSSSEYLSLIHI